MKKSKKAAAAAASSKSKTGADSSTENMDTGESGTNADVPMESAADIEEPEAAAVANEVGAESTETSRLDTSS